MEELKIEKNIYICIIAFITLLILLGTINKVFALTGLLAIILLILYLDDADIISLMIYLVSFANIFKMSPDGLSFFTILELAFVALLVYKGKINMIPTLGIIVIFFLYLVGNQLANNGIDIPSTIKLVANFLIIAQIGIIDIEKNIKKMSFHYFAGIILASIASYFNPSFLRIENYINSKQVNIDGTYVRRFAGMYQDPNFYAVNLIIAICLICVLYFRREISGKIGLLIALAMVSFAGFTGSKSAIFSMCIPGIVLLKTFKERGEQKKIIAFYACVIILLILVMSGKIPIFDVVMSRLTKATDAKSLTTGRSALWEKYIAFLLDNPNKLFFGSSILTLTIPGSLAPHNSYIDLLYQFGIVGGCIYLFVLISIFKSVVIFEGKHMINYSVLLCIVIMYFFLSELQYFDLPIHFALCLAVMRINIPTTKNGLGDSGNYYG